MDAPSVVWICGPPGVGKSTVGWLLSEHWASQGLRVGYLDIDQLAMRFPPSEEPDDATHTKAANLAAVLPHYTAAGAERIVVTGVATAAEVPVFEEAIGAVHWVRLTAARARLHRRFTFRDGPVEMLPEVDRHADDLDVSTFAQLVIDTSEITPTEIADELQNAVPLPPHKPSSTGPSGDRPSSRSRRRPPTQGDVEVLLLTGPRTVGTSTTGWEVFTRSQRENPTAFIDLAQIGFISAGPHLSSRDHHLRAANLAAMVEVYRERACRRIIAVGAVLDATERDLYAAALAPVPLSIFRLTATPDQLRQRATARTAPTGGPHLAGDDLRGRSDQAITEVLDQALREADQIQLSDIADHVIDTQYLSAGQAAERIANLSFVAPKSPSR